VTHDDLRPIVLAELTRVAPELDATTLRSDTPLRDQVDLDSMDFLNVVIGLHERLGIDIPEADYARLSSIDAIVAYAASKLGAGGHGADRPPGGLR
jgi:acyl carrier protein